MFRLAWYEELVSEQPIFGCKSIWRAGVGWISSKIPPSSTNSRCRGVLVDGGSGGTRVRPITVKVHNTIKRSFLVSLMGLN